MEVEPDQGPAAKHPLEIFPAEVWKLVLNEIEDPNDKWNAAHAHPLFRKLLISDRDAWMSMLLSLALPELIGEGHLDENDIVGMRQVNKGWRNSVDTFLENWRDQDHSEFIGMIVTNALDHHARNISGVLVQMRENPKARILGGAVWIFLRQGEDMEDVHSFFQQHGHKILRLRLEFIFGYEEDFLEVDWSPVEIAEVVKQILTTTPKLKTLIVCTDDRIEEGVEDSQVEQYLRQNPFPILPDLINLRLHFLTNEGFLPPVEDSEAVHRGICEAYLSQLQGLSLAGLNVEPYAPLIPNSGPLVSLSLAIEDLGGLVGLRSVKAPLKVLELKLPYQVFCQNVNLVFEILEQFGQSLRRLLFSINYPHSYDNTKDFGEEIKFPEKVNLPGLQKFGIFNHQLIISSATSFNFLLNFSKLRELRLELSEYRDTGLAGDGTDGSVLKIEMNESVDGKWYKGRFIKECRIWEKLTWLQKADISIRSDCFSESDDDDGEDAESDDDDGEDAESENDYQEN